MIGQAKIGNQHLRSTGSTARADEGGSANQVIDFEFSIFFDWKKRVRK